MNTNASPVIETPAFLLSSDFSITGILITIMFFFLFIFLVYSYPKIKNAYRLLGLLNRYKNKTITAREAAYELTSITNKFGSSPGFRYTRNEIDIINYLKYNRPGPHASTGFKKIISKTMQLSLLGKY